MAYPTRAELVAASANDQLKALDNAQQDALREMAIISVEGYCGQSFAVEGTAEAPVTRLVAGTGSRELFLPRRLEQLVSISIPSGVITASDVAIDAGEHNRIFLERTGSSTWAERALREAGELVFPRGADQVTIAGVWGWPDCPPAVVQALRFDMEDAASAESSELAPSLRAWRKLGMDSMAQGALSVQLADRPLVLSPRAADTLDTAGMVWADVGEVV
jgi:hypothetical protein